MTRQLLSVVVPVHNEQANLRELHRRLAETGRAMAGEADLELVFVDDGSTDGSRAVLEELAALDARVVVVQLTRNWGSHAAVKAGLRVSRGDCCAAVSADLQDPPEMLPQLHHAYQQGYEVVWGTRVSRQDPLVKTLWARSFYAIFSRLALPNLPPGGVDVFLISRRVRDEVLALSERHTPPYYQMLWLGYPYTIVPYHRAARRAGVSKWSFGRRLRMAWDSLIAFTPLPLRVLTAAGALLLAAGLLWGLGWLLGLLAGGTGALLCALSGLQLAGMGVLGEYLWRVAADVRHRPEYAVRRVLSRAVPPVEEKAA